MYYMIIIIIIIDCTRNIYGRLCSQISYFLPFECIGSVGCDDECEDELKRRVSRQLYTIISLTTIFTLLYKLVQFNVLQYGCCARSSFATSLQSVVPFCHSILRCPLPSSGRAELYSTATLLVALIITAGTSVLSTLPR